MSGVLSITFPIFAAIAIGYATVALRIFRAADMRVLGAYVLNIAMPALLFSAVATRELGEVLNWGFLAAMALGGLATAALGYALTAATGTGPARRAIAVMGMTCPNSAFIGYPVLLLALPEIAGPVLALNFLVENVLLIPLGLMLLELSRPRAQRSLIAVAGGIFLDVARKPFVIGLALGIAVSVLKVPLPEPVTRLTGILAASAAAVSLIVIGGTLYGLPLRGNRWLAAQIAAGKLILHPLLVAGTLLLLPHLGMAPVPEAFRTAAILSAAVPMFGIYAVLAQPYGHEGIASLAMLAATLGAFVTLTALLALLA